MKDMRGERAKFWTGLLRRAVTRFTGLGEGRGSFDGLNKIGKVGRILTGRHEIMKYMKRA
jgi:hypothetical protein